MNNEDNKPKDDDWGMTMPHMRLDKNADDFSDNFKPNPYSSNQPPADDWGATQQNFNLPQNQSSSADFDKTTPNINIPRDAWHETPPSSSQSSPDDWGMTTPNINISPEQKKDDWGATAPNTNVPQENKADDWGVTALNVNVPKQEKKDDWSMPAPVFRISEGEKIDNLPKRSPDFNKDQPGGFDKTTPNFNLSELSPPKAFNEAPPGFQAQPNVSEPSPVNQPVAETPKTEKPKSSKLIFVLGGLIVMMFLAIVVLAGVYFLFLNKPPQSAQTIETPREEPKEVPKETTLSSAPAIMQETALPKTIEYKGAMVLVSAGEFTMGSDTDADESKPAHKVTLPSFYIDKYEVTNAEYKAFCDATGKSYPPNPHLETDYFTKRPNAPVVGVSFSDAKAYAGWAGKRLPTEEEWEKAASWDEAAQAKRQFPWGNDFQKSNVAFGVKSISDVGKFSGGSSSCGAMDMAGNVLEWVDAFFQPYPNSTSTNAEFGEKNRIVRGGHFGSKSNESLKTTKRIYIPPNVASGEDDEKLVAAIIGFRCAVSADESAVKEVLTAQSK